MSWHKSYVLLIKINILTFSNICLYLLASWSKCFSKIPLILSLCYYWYAWNSPMYCWCSTTFAFTLIYYEDVNIFLKRFIKFKEGLILFLWSGLRILLASWNVHQNRHSSEEIIKYLRIWWSKCPQSLCTPSSPFKKMTILVPSTFRRLPRVEYTLIELHYIHI